MNRSLRLLVEESIREHILSRNLLLISIACIQYRMKSGKYDADVCKQQSISMARVALKNGISKEDIVSAIKEISDRDYPTMDMVASVAEICTQTYKYEEKRIPDRLIKRKPPEEIADEQRRREAAEEKKAKVKVKEKVEVNLDDPDLKKLMEFIEDNLINAKLNEDHAEILQRFREKEQYDYGLILLAFKFAQKEIRNVKIGFETSFDKLRYILPIMKKHVPEAQERLKREELEMDMAQRVDLSVYQNKEWNFRGTGSPLGAADRVREAEERIRKLSHEFDEEIDIDSLW